MCLEETTENKADEPLISLERDNQSKENKHNRKSRDEIFHLISYYVKEIVQDSQVNMSLSMFKILKFIILVSKRIEYINFVSMIVKIFFDA